MINFFKKRYERFLVNNGIRIFGPEVAQGVIRDGLPFYGVYREPVAKYAHNEKGELVMVGGAYVLMPYLQPSDNEQFTRGPIGLWTEEGDFWTNEGKLIRNPLQFDATGVDEKVIEIIFRKQWPRIWAVTKKAIIVGFVLTLTALIARNL